MRARHLCPSGILDRTPPAQAVLRPSKNGRGMEIYAFVSPMMNLHTLSNYAHSAFPDLPGWHWGVMGIVALAVAFASASRKKASAYGSVALGLAVFYGLFLLDALVLMRLGRPTTFDPALNLAAEYRRLTNGNQQFWVYLVFNIAAFVPFGFLTSEAFSARGKSRNWGVVVLIAFGLSLFAESLQWMLRVGFFEVTDMVLNTLGAALGAAVALGIRALFRSKKV